MNRKDIYIGFLIVLLWGMNFITIKLGLNSTPPLLMAAIRLFIVAFPIIFLLPRPPIAWHWLILLGLTLNAGQFSFLFMGMKLGMPAGLASFVLQSQAFFTLILAVFFLKERWYGNNLVGLLLAAFGMVAIGFQHSNGMTILGFGLTIAAAFSWGIGNIIIRHASKGVPAFSSISLIVWAGAIAIIPLMILSFFIEGPKAWSLAAKTITLTSALSIIYLSYFGTLIGYSLWGKLLSHNSAILVSPFALLVPIVAILFSSIILKETLSIWQITGGFLILIGLFVNVFGGKLLKGLRSKVKLQNIWRKSSLDKTIKEKL